MIYLSYSTHCVTIAQKEIFKILWDKYNSLTVISHGELLLLSIWYYCRISSDKYEHEYEHEYLINLKTWDVNIISSINNDIYIPYISWIPDTIDNVKKNINYCQLLGYQ